MASKKYKYILCLIALIPPFLQLKTIIKYAVNFPYQDDYQAILQFLCNYKKASFTEKIELLLSQHNEHRLFFSRIIIVLEQSMNQNFDFRHIIFFNFFMLFVIFMLFVVFAIKCIPEHWMGAAIIISLSLFNLDNYENADVALTGIFNYSVIMLFMLSIFLYDRKNIKWLIPAGLVQLICIFSGGNGIIGGFFIVLFTLLCRERIAIIVSVLTFLIFAPLYYFHSTAAVTSAATSVEISKIFQVFVTSSGGSFGLQYAMLGGILLLTAYVLLFPVSQKYKINKAAVPLMCVSAFMIVSLGAMGYFRRTIALEYACSSRYLIYAHLLYCVVFVFLFIAVKNYKVLLASIAFTASFYIMGYNTSTVQFEGFHNTLVTTDYYFPFKDVAKQITDESCKLNIYCIEKEHAKAK